MAFWCCFFKYYRQTVRRFADQVHVHISFRIFHVLKVRGAPGQRRGFRVVYGASGQRGSPPAYAPNNWWDRPAAKSHARTHVAFSEKLKGQSQHRYNSAIYVRTARRKNSDMDLESRDHN